MGRHILYHDTVTSTNTLGFEAVESNTPHGTVILAEHQSEGKGRLGRVWHSPYGKNLYFSVALTRCPHPSLSSWLPLITGVALAESLEEVSGLTISLKWPNDVMIHEKKIAGVLCESRKKRETGMVFVVGIGINVNSEKKDFPEELRDIATSLQQESHRQFDRHALLALFLTIFESHYELLRVSNLQTLKSKYLSRCATLGRQIKAHFSDGTQLEGMAMDIGEEGELQVSPLGEKGTSTMMRIRSGDIFHLR